MRKKVKSELEEYITKDLDRITINPDDIFTYSVIVGRFSKGLFETLDNAVVGFNKPVLKCGIKVTEKTKTYKIAKIVKMTSAPFHYINNNCKLYINNNKTKKKKKK